MERGGKIQKLFGKKWSGLSAWLVMGTEEESWGQGQCPSFWLKQPSGWEWWTWKHKILEDQILGGILKVKRSSHRGDSYHRFLQVLTRPLFALSAWCLIFQRMDLIKLLFFWPHLQHLEVPRARDRIHLQPEPQLWQLRILNPLALHGNFWNSFILWVTI